MNVTRNEITAYTNEYHGRTNNSYRYIIRACMYNDYSNCKISVETSMDEGLRYTYTTWQNVLKADPKKVREFGYPFWDAFPELRILLQDITKYKTYSEEGDVIDEFMKECVKCMSTYKSVSIEIGNLHRDLDR